VPLKTNVQNTQNTPHTPGHYVAYYRVDPKQGISRLGLEAQREAVARYIAGTKGAW
jgi:hypothetical protein